jgi:uncharacterized protein (UPF0147 family)
MFDSSAVKPIRSMIKQQLKAACCVSQLRRVSVYPAMPLHAAMDLVVILL